MVKKRLKYLMAVVVMVGWLHADSLYDAHCVTCHERENISLQKAFMNALLVYGGKENMKAGLAHYFRAPRRDISVMDEAVLRRSGVKRPLDINDTTLDSLLDEYWQKYTVIGKLR